DEESGFEQEDEEGGVGFIAHVPVPSQKEVGALTLCAREDVSVGGSELFSRPSGGGGAAPEEEDGAAAALRQRTLQAQSQTAKALLGL
ncbi:unnamed protein product, partial [Tetraodon nigroviridis]